MASLTADMMNQGTKNLSSGDFSEALERLGASVNVSHGFYTNLINITTMTETLPQTLKLVEELLLEPGFREQDFEKVKSRTLESMAQSRHQPSWLAQQAFRQLMYGDTRMGLPDEGQADLVADITLEQVRDYYQRYYHPANGHVLIAGDLSKSQAEQDFAFLTKWQGEAPKLGKVEVKPQPAKPGIYIVDVPDAVQSVVRVGRRALPQDATGPFFYANLMNFNLGGNFNSRINLNLREDKGFTYGANSYFTGNRDAGVFLVASDVRGDVTAEAIKNILQEFEQFKEQGPSAAELAYLRSSYSQQDALAYETLGDKAGFLLQLAMMKLSPDYLAKQQQIVAKVDQVRLTELAAQWLDPADMVIVVVGDKAKLEKSLQSLNLPLYDFTIE